jgi:hypothetical protein
MEGFKLTRVYTDQNGESQFEDISYPVHDNGPLGFLSDKIKVKEIIFRKVTPTYDSFHNAPQKQFVVLLDGSVEIETSLNEKRVFSSGDVLLMEDVSGKGHRSRNLIPEVRHSLFITFHEQARGRLDEVCL